MQLEKGLRIHSMGCRMLLETRHHTGAHVSTAGNGDVIVIVIDYTQHWPLLGRRVPKVIPIHASYVSSPPDPEHIDHTEMSLQLFA
jgi:hypothetical protein